MKIIAVLQCLLLYLVPSYKPGITFASISFDIGFTKRSFATKALVSVKRFGTIKSVAVIFSLEVIQNTPN